VKIFFVNNQGSGYADTIEVVDGMSIKAFFARQLPGAREDAYAIRVNRNPVDEDYVLHDGDRVTITPAKIAGAVKRAVLRTLRWLRIVR
jgi:sulfur carrier protein ThiS